jgi:hypothetical protein
VQIEIDFDVWKALNNLRESEDTTLSDVLRGALKLGGASTVVKSRRPAPTEIVNGASFKGVFLPDGTLLRVTYKGRMYAAEIKDGRWIDHEGNARTSPSEAARAISNTQVNGWRFWEVKRPRDGRWRRLDMLKA